MQVLEGHKGHVFSLAFSPDGRTLASGDAYNVIRLWDLAAGTERRRFKVNRPKHRNPGVHGLAFHPGGGALVAAGGSSEPTIFDLATGKPRGRVVGHTHPVHLAAYTGGGEIVTSGRVMGYGSAEVIVWEGDPPRVRTQLAFTYDSIQSLSVSPDGESIALGTGLAGFLWAPSLTPPGARYTRELLGRAGGPAPANPPDGSAERCLRILPHPVDQDMAAVAFSPDGRFLATTHWTFVRLLDAKDFRVLAVLEGHTEPVQALAFSPDGRTLASGSQDGTLRLWDVDGRSERDCLDAEDGWVNAIAFAPEGMTVAASCEEDIFLWDVGGDAW